MTWWKFYLCVSTPHVTKPWGKHFVYTNIFCIWILFTAFHFMFFLSWRDSPLVGLGLLLIREGFCGLLITPNDTPQSVELLWTNDQFVAETRIWKHITLTTDKYPCPGGIRTHDRSRRAAVGLRFRLRGYWDRHYFSLCILNILIR